MRLVTFYCVACAAIGSASAQQTGATQPLFRTETYVVYADGPAAGKH
jgi:hypothetical protein